MIYQVRVNFYIKNEGQARGLYQHCHSVFPQATSINPDAENAEFSVLELIENHHDESPNAPCHLLGGITSRPAPPEPPIIIEP